MEWSWATFPLAAAAFGLLAFVLGRSLKVDRLQVNQAEVVDADVDSSLLRGVLWADLYSPRSAVFDFRLAPEPGLDGGGGSKVLLSWQGLPGDGLGGLNTNSSVPEQASYQLAAGEAASSVADPLIRGMPIPIASSRSISGRWRAKCELPWRGRLTSDADGLLRGEFSNPLPVALSDCMLFYGVWAHRVDGTLEPGDTVPVSPQPRNLEWHLVRRRVVETTDIGSPWDRGSFDVPRILEIMMFYQSAGGQAYTGLCHRYQAYLDLSDHLRTGRAVLLGRGRAPATRLAINGRPLDDDRQQRWTFYRVIFPVDRPNS